MNLLPQPGNENRFLISPAVAYSLHRLSYPNRWKPSALISQLAFKTQSVFASTGISRLHIYVHTSLMPLYLTRSQGIFFSCLYALVEVLNYFPQKCSKNARTDIEIPGMTLLSPRSTKLAHVTSTGNENQRINLQLFILEKSPHQTFIVTVFIKWKQDCEGCVNNNASHLLYPCFLL
jgi:hypothetical protein